LLLPKLGNSNLEEQILALQEVLPLFKEYKIIVLADSLRHSFASREFCSVDVGILAQGSGYIFCLRLKKNYCLETEKLMWRRLYQLGVVPGTSLYFKGVRVRKTRPVAGFDIACKWKRNYSTLRD